MRTLHEYQAQPRPSLKLLVLGDNDPKDAVYDYGREEAVFRNVKCQVYGVGTQTDFYGQRAAVAIAVERREGRYIEPAWDALGVEGEDRGLGLGRFKEMDWLAIEGWAAAEQLLLAQKGLEDYSQGACRVIPQYQ